MTGEKNLTDRMVRVAAIAISLVVASAQARAADAGDIAEGMRIFQQKANCQACHGWVGDGRKLDNQMPDSPSLRETRLDRGNLVTTIKCGRPGRGMPAFDKFAYSDGRCNGIKQADLTSRGLTLADPPATLQPREIEMLADFLFAKIVGKGAVTRATCIELADGDAEVCRDLK